MLPAAKVALAGVAAPAPLGSGVKAGRIAEVKEIGGRGGAAGRGAKGELALIGLAAALGPMLAAEGLLAGTCGAVVAGVLLKPANGRTKGFAGAEESVILLCYFLM